MKIAVCIKQVPTRDWQPRLNDANTWIREQDASYEMNEPDAYALEEALRVKDATQAEVVVASIGPERVTQALRTALGMGADRAIHVKDAAADGSDPLENHATIDAELRYPSLKGIMAAKKKPLDVKTVADLGLEGQVGAGAAKIKVEKIAPPPKGTGAEMLTGSTDQIVSGIVGKIKELGLL